MEKASPLKRDRKLGLPTLSLSKETQTRIKTVNFVTPKHNFPLPFIQRSKTHHPLKSHLNRSFQEECADDDIDMTPSKHLSPMEAMLVPPWLESLLSTPFFSICPAHKDAPRSECNMYCLDCNNGAFCFYCRSSRHKDHQVIQIRRSSYHDVVRVAEIQKVLDISGVQTYVINSARVLFLNERPQPKTAVKGSSHVCEICARSLLDPFRFCSLGCKLVGLKKSNGDSSFILRAKNEEEDGRREGIAIRLASNKELLEDQLREGMQQDMYQSTPPPQVVPQSNSRRRKGIPHRAPLGP